MQVLFHLQPGVTQVRVGSAKSPEVKEPSASSPFKGLCRLTLTDR